MKLRTLSLILAIPLVGAATPAMAGTSTGSLPISALVLENCTVVATPMAFGALTEVGEANVDTTSLMTLVCTPNADFEIGLDDGLNASNGQRRMKNAASDEFLPYEIYADAGRTQVWGNTSGVDMVEGDAPIGLATVTAYGRIAEGVAGVSAGSYSDTVTITVNF